MQSGALPDPAVFQRSMSKLEDLRIDAPPPRPRRRSYFPWFPVVFVLFIAVAGMWLFRDAIAGIGSQEKQDKTEEKQPAVNAPVAESKGPPGSISAAGYLEVIPPGPVVASSIVAGKVESILVTPGDVVSAGQRIAQLDTATLQRKRSILASRVGLAQSRLDRVSAGSRSQEIDQAQAEVDSAEARLSLAQTELSRAEDLYAKGVIAGQELDTRLADAEMAQAALEQSLSGLELLNAGTRVEDIRVAEAELSAARTELAEVDWEISQCSLTAPADGVVLELFVQAGDWLSPGTDNPRSSAVLSSFEPRMIQAWVDVNQRDSGSLFSGQQVELTTDAHPRRVVSGTVSKIMPVANLQKNTVQVKISIDDPPPDFRPELSVKVSFLPPQEPASQDEEVSDEPV